MSKRKASKDVVLYERENETAGIRVCKETDGEVWVEIALFRQGTVLMMPIKDYCELNQLMSPEVHIMGCCEEGPGDGPAHSPTGKDEFDGMNISEMRRKLNGGRKL